MLRSVTLTEPFQVSLINPTSVRFKFYQLEISSNLGVGLIDGDSASKTKLHDMYLQKYSSY